MQSSSSPSASAAELLFSHAALYEQAEGQLRVTPASLAFEANDGSKRVNLAWPQVEKDLYSPEKEPRVLLRITTVVAGAPALVFQLVNQPRERLRSELERLKVIIKSVRKPASASQASSTSGASSSVQNSRQALLLADAALLREYNALVRDGKIVDDADFWREKEGLLASFEASRAISSSRGALSAILSDFAVEEVGREKKIVLNPEIISHIFEMYPAVRKAYDTNVPHAMTEEAFWTQYFRSAYFARDKAASRAAAMARGADGAVRSDDFFGRHDPTLKSSESKDGLAVAAEEQSELKKRRIAPSLDLTSTYNDYAVLETADVAISGLGSDGHSNPIVAKYMKNTSIALRSLPDSLAEEEIAKTVAVADAAMTTTPGGSADTGAAVAVVAASEDTLAELIDEPAPAYVDVSFKGHDGNAQGGTHGKGGDGSAHHLTQPPRAPVSAMKASDITRTASQAFCNPSRQQSAKVDDALRRLMLDAESLSSPFSFSSSSSTGEEAGAAAPLQAQTFPEEFTRVRHLLTYTYILPQDPYCYYSIVQVVLEHFSYIAQLLRHFYAALDQAGRCAHQASSSAASAAADKARKIVAALEARRDAVMQFKKEIQASSQAVEKGECPSS